MGAAQKASTFFLMRTTPLGPLSLGRENDLSAALDELRQRENCDSANFATRYLRDHSASEEEVAAYVVKLWKTISQSLGVPIPHARLKDEFGK
jgi:hypothetical protein